MNSLHFGVNHLQRRPHNKIPTFFNQGEEQEGEKKISSRHTYQKARAGCWTVRVPGLKYSSTAQERETLICWIHQKEGRQASKRCACQAAANESWTWKQSRQAWQSQRDAGIVCKQNTKKRRASKESLTSVTSSTYWQAITIGCRRDNCCRGKKKQPPPPPNKKDDKEKKRRGWEKKECRRENERKNERETERKRMPVA
jgi:hypothetical protein